MNSLLSQFQNLSDSIKNGLSNDVEFALLFGSVVTNRITPESDIDVGVYCKKQNLSFEERLDLKDRLESVTKREVDVVFLNSSDIIITMQILANGKLIVNNDPGLFALFKSQKISEYIDFKRDRKAIEDNLFVRRIYD